VKYVVLIAWLLFMSVSALAATYSDANLNGSYSVQFASPQTYTWSKTFACPSNSSVHYTVSGSQTGMQVGYGVVTFDGKGNLSITSTVIGMENPTASANTTSVTWNSSCQIVAVNNGHVVYNSAITGTSTGTYSIQSNGTGTMTVTGSPQAQSLLLAATSAGISTTVLITNPLVNGNSIGTGIAVRQ
jgi:hypothetical protein